jgi:hypothetical protein
VRCGTWAEVGQNQGRGGLCTDVGAGISVSSVVRCAHNGKLNPTVCISVRSTENRTEVENRKDRQFGSVWLGSGFFFGFGLKMPTPA